MLLAESLAAATELLASAEHVLPAAHPLSNLAAFLFFTGLLGAVLHALRVVVELRLRRDALQL